MIGKDKKTWNKKVICFEKCGRGHLYYMQCAYCNESFKIMGKSFNRGYGTFCSVSCANKALRKHYKDGSCKLKGGYIGVETKDKRANSKGYYSEHRIIIENSMHKNACYIGVKKET